MLFIHVKEFKKQDFYGLSPFRTTPEKFETAALFLRFSLPSTPIRHENWPFWEQISLWVLVRAETKKMKTELFKKLWRHANHVISLLKFFSNTNPSWTAIVAFLNFSDAGWKAPQGGASQNLKNTTTTSCTFYLIQTVNIRQCTA